MLWWQQLNGCFRALHLLLSPSSRQALQHIVADATTPGWLQARRRTIVFVTGYPGTGKTTLSRTHPELGQMTRFDGDHYVVARDQAWPWLKGDGDRDRTMRLARAIITVAAFSLLFLRLIRRGQSLVYDYTNLLQQTRWVVLTLAWVFGFRRLIVLADCETSLRQARMMADPARILARAEPTFERALNAHLRPELAHPRPSECEHFTYYRSDQLRPHQLVIEGLEVAPDPLPAVAVS